ncbi:uroporphyrinogen-III synthase [Arthrobacter sp. Sa2CUA1]|uniref:Uroporphyrinogen-III synthase n=1 Tax=Arthrobacter gallicola TaxID=2762225 RepID=A0ABR8UTA2_9MICC|nr:uroporphyrinogen-III synthase [Arthrobacter gallicola]MBD7995326.1 uroporphyrinogen-III synthase [Arthrobacter gallicola]
MTTDRARPAPTPAGGTLSGADVVLLRSPDRAGPMAAELRARGAQVQLLPLIDFQLPADTSPVSAGLQELGEGSFDWIIFTSATTVRALHRFAAGSGRTLSQLTSGTRVAAVGAGTRQALSAQGINADLVPEADQSARGLAAAWPEPGTGRNRLLLPQADIADPFLRTALADTGWEVSAVTAYQTVDYPAPAGLRLEPDPAVSGPGSSPASGESAQLTPAQLTPAQYRRFAAASGAGADRAPHAVVVTSPSTARRFVRDALVPGAAVLVAIGEPTAHQLRALDHAPEATASAPTPAGIADAVEAALAAHRISHYPRPEGNTSS